MDVYYKLLTVWHNGYVMKCYEAYKLKTLSVNVIYRPNL